jgi:hypothetical protein
MTYQPVQARNRLRPRSGLSLAKLNMNVYMSTVGSATPRISSGCPPTMEWITPHRAVDANVCTAVRTPSAHKVSSPTPKQNKLLCAPTVLTETNATKYKF